MTLFKSPKEFPEYTPVLGLDEAGKDMTIWSLIGPVEYNRDDSEELAKYLERMAGMVRSHK